MAQERFDFNTLESASTHQPEDISRLQQMIDATLAGIKSKIIPLVAATTLIVTTSTFSPSKAATVRVKKSDNYERPLQDPQNPKKNDKQEDDEEQGDQWEDVKQQRDAKIQKEQDELEEKRLAKLAELKRIAEEKDAKARAEAAQIRADRKAKGEDIPPYEETVEINANYQPVKIDTKKAVLESFEDLLRGIQILNPNIFKGYDTIIAGTIERGNKYVIVLEKTLSDQEAKELNNPLEKRQLMAVVFDTKDEDAVKNAKIYNGFLNQADACNYHSNLSIILPNGKKESKSFHSSRQPKKLAQVDINANERLKESRFGGDLITFGNERKDITVFGEAGGVRFPANGPISR